MFPSSTLFDLAMSERCWSMMRFWLWMLACLSRSCWPFFFLSLREESGEGWEERGEGWEERGERREGCGLPDVRVLAAGGGAAVNPRPGRLNPPSVMGEPPPVPGQVVQLPDRGNSSAVIQCSISPSSAGPSVCCSRLNICEFVSFNNLHVNQQQPD